MDRIKALLVLLAAVAFAAAPFLGPSFDGFDPAAFPVPQVDPPITPAGYAFSIWGVIYSWLIVHAAFGLLQRTADPIWDRTRWPLMISLGIGTGWLSVAATSPLLATLMIWAMLITALMALFASHKSRDRWLLQAPIAIYAGWLSAASWVSVGLTLSGYGLIDTARVAALIALPLALLFAMRVQWALARAPEYGGAVVWALVGIIAANLGSGLLIPLIALAGILILGLVMLRAIS